MADILVHCCDIITVIHGGIAWPTSHKVPHCDRLLQVTNYASANMTAKTYFPTTLLLLRMNHYSMQQNEYLSTHKHMHQQLYQQNTKLNFLHLIQLKTHNLTMLIHAFNQRNQQTNQCNSNNSKEMCIRSTLLPNQSRLQNPPAEGGIYIWGSRNVPHEQAFPPF